MQTANQNDVVQPSAPLPEEEKKTLHERVSDYEKLVAEADGEFTDEVRNALGSIVTKAEGCKRWMRELASRESFHAEEETFHAQKKMQYRRLQEKFKAFVAEEMERAELSEIKTRLGKIYFKETPAVKITEESKWVETAPEKYVKTEKSAKKNVLLALYRDALARNSGPDVSENKAHELALAELPEGANVVISRSLVL